MELSVGISSAFEARTSNAIRPLGNERVYLPLLKWQIHPSISKGYERVYLPLPSVADTPFHIEGGKLIAEVSTQGEI